MNLGLRIKLSAMMFLQYAVWSIWQLMLFQRMKDLHLDGRPFGWILMTTGLGSILGPFVMGQLADRYFATEKVLAVAHLAGGLLLIATAYATTFWPIFLLMLLYCHLYFPTVGLTNSLTFRALGEGNQSRFAMIRFWGTIGWILGTWALALYLNSTDVSALQPWFRLVGPPGNYDVLRMAGVVSLIYGLYCFALPHTPPVPAKPTDPAEKRSAVAESLELMRNRSFAVLVIVAGLFGMMLNYYFQNENPFLDAIGTKKENIGAFMTIGNIFEMISMALVPIAVATLGIKRTMLAGGMAYAVMFGLKMLGRPWALMIASNSLHGFCFGFFFVVSQMFVDKAASLDIKASAQGLLVFIVFGLGNLLGNWLGGEVRERLQPNWTAIWTVPFVAAVVSIAAFALLFREGEIRKSAVPVEATTA